MRIKDFILKNAGNVELFIITDGVDSITIKNDDKAYTTIENIIIMSEFKEWDILPSKKSVIIYI